MEYLLEQISPTNPLAGQVMLGIIAAILLLNKVWDVIQQRKNKISSNNGVEELVAAIEQIQQRKELHEGMRHLVEHMERENEIFQEIGRLIHKMTDTTDHVCQEVRTLQQLSRLDHDRILEEIRRLYGGLKQGDESS